MRHTSRLATGSFVIVLAVAAAAASAQTQVRHRVVAPGGRSTAGPLELYNVVGQTVTGSATTAGTGLRTGFVPVAAGYLRATPTAVTITAFEAVANRDGIRLTWTIGSSDGLVGYHIYRSRSRDGGFADIAGGLIPAAEGTQYTDRGVHPGTTYYYRLGAVDADGEFRSHTLSVTTPVWRTELEQNRPNPFNPSTAISFYLSEALPVKLIVYDAQGRRVRTLVDRPLSDGTHDVQWDGTNDAGGRVSSGVYFYRLRAGKEIFTKKMTLLK